MGLGEDVHFFCLAGVVVVCGVVLGGRATGPRVVKGRRPLVFNELIVRMVGLGTVQSIWTLGWLGVRTAVHA